MVRCTTAVRMLLRHVVIRQAIPFEIIAALKVLANKRDVPYQSLLTVFLAEKVAEELRIGHVDSV